MAAASTTSLTSGCSTASWIASSPSKASTASSSWRTRSTGTTTSKCPTAFGESRLLKKLNHFGSLISKGCFIIILKYVSYVTGVRSSCTGSRCFPTLRLQLGSVCLAMPRTCCSPLRVRHSLLSSSPELYCSSSVTGPRHILLLLARSTHSESRVYLLCQI